MMLLLFSTKTAKEKRYILEEGYVVKMLSLKKKIIRDAEFFWVLSKK